VSDGVQLESISYDASMNSLPSGTVTFVFTDIEGSTELLKRLGEGYGQVLTEHRRIVRETFATANGVEIDTQGDAFFFAFARARDAVGAAVDVQRAHASNAWPEGSLVRVRMGLHTGEPALGDEGYLGLDVVRAARICMAARGGNVLLSESTRALLGSTLPDGVSIFPRGERHLKGIDEPERVYELAIEGVETEEVEEAEPLAPAARASGGAEQEEVERRFEDFGSRLAAEIQDQVLRSLDRGLGKAGTPSSGPPGENKDVADLAERGVSLQDRILARVDAALKAKGISREGRS
jgi:class 3 adenylate cyclase